MGFTINVHKGHAIPKEAQDLLNVMNEEEHIRWTLLCRGLFLYSSYIVQDTPVVSSGAKLG